MKKTIPFRVATTTTKNKVPRNKFNQGGKISILGNYRILKKEIEKDTNK